MNKNAIDQMHADRRAAAEVMAFGPVTLWEIQNTLWGADVSGWEAVQFMERMAATGYARHVAGPRGGMWALTSAGARVYLGGR